MKRRRDLEIQGVGDRARAKAPAVARELIWNEGSHSSERVSEKAAAEQCDANTRDRSKGADEQRDSQDDLKQGNQQ